MLSKRNEPKEGTSTNSPSQSLSNSNIIPHFPSYQPLLRHGPSLNPIPLELTTITVESDVSSSSLSLDSLLHVTRSLPDINKQVVEHILQSKEDIQNNPNLLDLVKEYFSSSSQVLDFYSAFEKCIKKIRYGHIVIQHAVTRFDEVLMRLKLQAKREKLDKKLKALRSYRKVSKVLFAAVFVAVVIWSVVAVAIAEPPLAAAVLAVSSGPLGTLGKWMSSLWKGYEGGMKKELDLVSEMDIDTLTAVTQLQNIKILVEKLKDKIEEMLSKAGVGLAIDDIEKNLAVFTQAVDVLGERSYKYGQDIGRAREVILQRIKNY